MPASSPSIIFAGTPEFAAHHLDALIRGGADIRLVVTQPDKPGKRGRQPRPSPVKAVALEAGLPVIQPERLRAADLEACPADVMIVVAYGQILRQAVLDHPRLGCVNVHASLLPRWRGAAPIQRAIQAGDRLTGVNIMVMEKGLDTGPVLAATDVVIEPDDTADTLTAKLVAAGTHLLPTVIDDLEARLAAALPQDEAAGVTYAHKLDKHEAEIDWHDDARTIAATIRAFNPDPVAFTTKDTLRIRLWQASSHAGPDNATEAPGTIVGASRDGLDIQSGDGVVTVTRLQLPVGKGKVMSVQDVLNSKPELLAVGSRFASNES